MKLRTYANIGFAFCVALPMLSRADERLSAKLSSDSRIHTDLDQHATDVRTLDRKFLEAISRLEQSYVEERQALRKALSQKVAKEKKALTKKGELDQAVALRDYIEQLDATPIAPPKPSGPRGILGTWRWNNGVDIRNLADGQTNGNGTWRLIDSDKEEYEFQWKQIPADRVTLSKNGRVLEGTKTNDLTFRVWAVRID
jgi:hypothetical protein